MNLTNKLFLILIVLLLLRPISAQEDKDQSFIDACPGMAAPMLIQLQAPATGFYAQYIDWDGDIVVQVFNLAMIPSSRKVFKGEYCNVPR